MFVAIQSCVWFKRGAGPPANVKSTLAAAKVGGDKFAQNPWPALADADDGF